MEWLNYHHLLYFRTVVKEGGITAASKQLRVAQPTISAQLKTLEQALGDALFTRNGRNLVLTDFGQVVYRYADEIFTIGQDLMHTIKGRPTGASALKLQVGASMVLPKLIVYRLLEPAQRLPEPVCLVVDEGKPVDLLARLSIYELDLVLTDAPIGSQAKVKAFNHLLGECGVTVFGVKKLARSVRRGFPKSLDGAPFLLPTQSATLRRSLDHWFSANGIRPKVIGEFQDSALLKVFGQVGHGLFVLPSVVEDDVCSRYDVQVVGRLKQVRERFYAISAERKVKNPAVLAITETARSKLFPAAETP